MPRRKRVEKVRTGALNFEQRMDLMLLPGRLGEPGVDGRVGRLWQDEDHREAAYFEHRDSLLHRFYVEGSGPPGAAIDYDDDPEFIRAAIDYYLGRAREDAARHERPPRWSVPEYKPRRPNAYAELVAELEALEGDPGDAQRARDLWWGERRRRVMQP